ncbi:MAG TPA: cytochrome c-type biogenesis protein [Stellaceae bacterium]|nr:cytochrome c-type biogenesis protein [Stellaceae bacterium]
MSGLKVALVVLLLLLLAPSAGAVQPGEQLSDPLLEARARALSAEFRCMVCQNESIDQSDADLAHDIRVLIRERLKAGDSDQQVRDFLVRRYGDFILLEPPVKPVTYLLWFGPFVLLVLGMVGIGMFLRTRGAAAPSAPLSAEERRRLERMLLDEEGE